MTNYEAAKIIAQGARSWLAGKISPVRTSAAAYDAAGTGQRSRRWLVTTESVNSAIFANASTLRSKARDQVRKNGLAANAVDTFESNAIGNGIKPQSQHPDEKVRAAIHALWREWIGEADADGTNDFYGMQAVAAREVFEAGEIFIRERPRRLTDGLSVPIQFQLLEPDFVPIEKTEALPSGNSIRGGIELNRIGRRVAYHFYRSHPGDGALVADGSLETTRVDARQVMHCFQVLRAGQLRGQPSLSPVLAKLYQLDLYDDAELERKKVAALFAGFLHKNSDDDNLLAETAKLTPTQDAIKMAEALTELIPGGMHVLLPGWDITFSGPSEVGNSYEPFMRVQLRLIAAGLGITYEQLTGDLSDVNFSSIRAGLVQFRRRCEKLQRQIFIHQMCRPIWRRWITAAVLSGALKVEGVNVLKEFTERPAGFFRAEWRPPAWEWVDPLKDMKAEELAHKLRIKSRDQTIKERGRDPEVVDEEIAASQKRARDLGIEPSAEAAQAEDRDLPDPLFDDDRLEESRQIQ